MSIIYGSRYGPLEDYMYCVSCRKTVHAYGGKEELIKFWNRRGENRKGEKKMQEIVNNTIDIEVSSIERYGVQITVMDIAFHGGQMKWEVLEELSVERKVEILELIAEKIKNGS